MERQNLILFLQYKYLKKLFSNIIIYRMEKNDENKNVVFDENGYVLFEFKDEPKGFCELTSEQEDRINSMMGASGAICMDEKTRIIDKNDKIDYGPLKDIAGNIVEDLPQVDEELLKKIKNKFVKNSIFH
jgi:hypothetical protein